MKLTTNCLAVFLITSTLALIIVRCEDGESVNSLSNSNILRGRRHHHHHIHHHHKNQHDHKQKVTVCDPLVDDGCPSLTTTPPDVDICSWPCSPLSYDESPLCGSDGLYYSSLCALEKAACSIRLRHGKEEMLEVDESGRKCSHFLQNVNHIQSQQFQPPLVESVDPIYPNNWDLDDHSLEQSDQPHPQKKEQNINMQKKKESSCSQEDFEFYKRKLFDLSGREWNEMTKGWTFGVSSPLDDDQAVVSSVWRRLLADGPEGDKDSLIQTIFTSLDRDHNFLLHYPELYQADLEELNLPELNLGQVIGLKNSKCEFQWRDFLRFQDKDGDDRIHVTEFYDAFSQLYGVTMISLEKALELKTIDVRAGEDVTLSCDVMGSPPTPISWTTPPQVSNDDSHLRRSVDAFGSLSILDVQLRHEGNYTCHSTRNVEVVQVHSLRVAKKDEG